MDGPIDFLVSVLSVDRRRLFEPLSFLTFNPQLHFKIKIKMAASSPAAGPSITSTTVNATTRYLLAAAAGAATILAAQRLNDARQGKRRKNRRRGQGDDGSHDEETQASGSRSSQPQPQATISRPGVVRGVPGLIGHTPLMRIESLSELTGCEILVRSSDAATGLLGGLSYLLLTSPSSSLLAYSPASHALLRLARSLIASSPPPSYYQGKAEFLNPAGSPKDRVALQILLDAESHTPPLLTPHSGDCVFEGTVGSTGISLATLCRAKGYRCSIVLPDDVATEKAQLLEKLGAEVKKVRPRGIVDKRHFVNEARALAGEFGMGEEREQEGPEGEARKRRPRGFFADQFETPSNFSAHYHGTGPEIWAQCGGTEDGEGGHGRRRPQLDAFVAGAGTGGTLSGVAAALREREARLASQAQEAKKEEMVSRWWPFGWLGKTDDEQQQSARPASEAAAHSIRIVLADPHGSGLYNKVRSYELNTTSLLCSRSSSSFPAHLLAQIHHGVLYSSTEAEGTRRRHQVDTIVEGIGMNRITRNLSFGVDLVDDAVRVSDEEAVRMSRWLSVRDGLFVGSSSAVNVVAAVRTALRLKREWEGIEKEGRPTVVTILCDSGVRHLSKFHNVSTSEGEELT